MTMYMNTNVLNDCKVVCLIRLPEGLSLLQFPKLLDYNNKHILGKIPCLQRGETFTDLRTGKHVKLARKMLVWPVSVGTMFEYGDGYRVLLSRTIADRKLVLIPKDEFKFNQYSMVRYAV